MNYTTYRVANYKNTNDESLCKSRNAPYSATNLQKLENATNPHPKCKLVGIFRIFLSHEILTVVQLMKTNKSLITTARYFMASG